MCNAMLRLETVPRIRVWLGLFIAAQFADLITTVFSLRFGGDEANPLVSGILAGGGVERFMLLKVLGAMAVAILIVGADELRRRLSPAVASRTVPVLTRVLQLGIGIQLLAAAQNLAVLGTTLVAWPRIS